MALHKLKIDSLKLKDGELKEVEVEGIEGAKVLLASFEGKTQALSSRYRSFRSCVRQLMALT